MKAALKSTLSLIFFINAIIWLDAGPAVGIVNGSDATGNASVVTLFAGDSSTGGYCTGVYFQDYAIVTAAHCIVAQDGRGSEFLHPVEQWYVSQPGVNWKTPEAISTRVPVLRIWVPSDYFNRWKPESNQVETQINDIAFLFIEEPLKGKPIRNSASRDELDAFRGGLGVATHFGYGCLGIPEGSTTIEPNNGKPYRIDNILGTNKHLPHIPIPDRHLQVKYPWGTSLCPGDSGSPLLLNRANGDFTYLGVIFAGNGWDEARKAQPRYQSAGDITTFLPFETTFNTEYNRFLSDITQLKEQRKSERNRASSVRQTAIDNGTYAKASGCHTSGISAAVEYQTASGTWENHKTAAGWEASGASCPSTHTTTPWTTIDLPDNTLIRWKFSGGNWTTYSDTLTWIRQPVVTSTTVLPKVQTKLETRNVRCVKQNTKIVKTFKLKSNKCPSGWRRA